MLIKIISALLILVTAYFGLSHGSRTFSKPSAEYLQMMALLGITDTVRVIFGICPILSVILILFPQTFFAGNVLRAVLLLLMMTLALKAGNYKFALIEIPFLAMPLLLIYLGHPLKNGY
ncbi:hypothetical protein SAMN06265348_11919 [Pedobacter westerhofensis]|uniref:DoxX-like family protein n=1 Tax=Pedobacter westerhofensis TaxID=425512 RepID=A0A521FS30_9SPHI|nr:hypothetical protein [Pedobacter westerhofensis]SMO99008.1 hypothetical protein SAMN06265348_11919 [Pedobacter westerhofensis]